MALQGKAKTDFQREYMRRRRAGLKAAKPAPKPAAQPDGREPESKKIESLLFEVLVSIKEVHSLLLKNEMRRIAKSKAVAKADLWQKANLEKNPRA